MLKTILLGGATLIAAQALASNTVAIAFNNTGEPLTATYQLCYLTSDGIKHCNQSITTQLEKGSTSIDLDPVAQSNKQFYGVAFNEVKSNTGVVLANYSAKGNYGINAALITYKGYSQEPTVDYSLTGSVLQANYHSAIGSSQCVGSFCTSGN